MRVRDSRGDLSSGASRNEAFLLMSKRGRRSVEGEAGMERYPEFSAVDVPPSSSGSSSSWWRRLDSDGSGSSRGRIRWCRLPGILRGAEAARRGEVVKVSFGRVIASQLVYWAVRAWKARAADDIERGRRVVGTPWRNGDDFHAAAGGQREKRQQNTGLMPSKRQNAKQGEAGEMQKKQQRCPLFHHVAEAVSSELWDRTVPGRGDQLTREKWPKVGVLEMMERWSGPSRLARVSPSPAKKWQCGVCGQSDAGLCTSQPTQLWPIS